MNESTSRVLTVLIAEDDENSRVLLQNALTSSGYKVLSAANGQEALILASADSPDMIVSDILMPVMDGYALCRAVKRDDTLKHIPFIFYSATYTDHKDRNLALSLGADRFLVKPVEIQELLAVIEEVLASIDPIHPVAGEPALPDEELESLHNERLQSKLGQKLAQLENQKNRLLESEQRFRDYAQASADWFWEADDQLIIIQITSGPNELLSRKLSDLAAMIDYGACPGKAGSQFLQDLEAKNAFQDLILEFADQQKRPLIIRFSGKPIHDCQGRFGGYRGIGRDITETATLIRKIEYVVTHDELTGLPNRSYFWERLNLALTRAKRNAYPVILFYIDVDHFKMINDTMGHDSGDQLLLEIARRIRRNIRDHDTIARIGGDEFVLVIEKTGPSDAHRIVLDILKMFETPIVLGAQRIFATVSIGLSVYPDDSDQAQTLVSFAELAMYRAKAKGRNNFHYYTDELNREACEWMAIENGLRQALERDEFFLVYQPQINLKNGRFEGVEALIRWQHPEQGLIWPDKFIPIAEQSGFIVSLGEWCLNAVCRQIRTWDQEGLGVPRVSVNISARHTRNNRIAEDIRRTLSSHRVSPKRLGIEITEHTLMEKVDKIRETLEEIHRGGTYLSLDDFGTGYSSLGYLKRIPVDELKIDASFIRGIADREDDTAIVKAIIALGQTLDKQVVAEGVENTGQANVLRRLNCDIVQGYLIAHPLPATELEKWMGSFNFQDFLNSTE
ncbi:MAG: two-component system response regulator [Methylococcales bacterium]